MSAQKQQHHLLLLPSLVIAFHFLPPAPLLNAALSGPAYSTPSCSTSANHISTTCSSKKLSISFPFFTSAECHNSESSFIISHCEPSNAFPDWPAFTKDATKGSALNSTVAIMYTPLPTGPLESQNSSPFSGFPFDPRSGYIALAWSSGLLDQPVCSTLADREQISQYIPHSINLQEFAHSAFNFDSSTIILLFSCNPTKINPSSYVQMNGSACTAYEKECKPNKDQSYNCYQYMASNPSKELSLPQLMNTSGCKQAMFFVVIDQSSVLLTWKPGAILLNWKATGTEWLASAFQACAGCLASNGSCGYDSRGEFDCSCGIDCFHQNISRPASPSPRPDALPSSLITIPGDRVCYGKRN
ncbi:hypothetical protein L7F22_012347 [Adiantum nelumboides]|nr:hypothetical protein [Adiantum nelumboides]